MEIKVCGTGCPKCDQAMKTVEVALEATGLDASIVKVTDFQEIAKLGVFTTPAVVIDDEIKCVGKVPKQSEVEKWIR